MKRKGGNRQSIHIPEKVKDDAKTPKTAQSKVIHRKERILIDSKTAGLYNENSHYTREKQTNRLSPIPIPDRQLYGGAA